MSRRATALSCLALTLAACGGSSPAPRAPGTAPTRLATSPADPSQCPAGGVAVTAGIDANANGVLDDAEVDRTYVVCNGADGASPAYTIGDGLSLDAPTSTLSVSPSWVSSLARTAAVDAAGDVGAQLAVLGGACQQGQVLKWDATSGAWRCAADQDTSTWADLSGKPDLSVYARSSQLAPVAASGSYADLSGAPWARSGSSTVATNAAGTAVDQDTALTPNGYDMRPDLWQSFTAGRSGPLAAVRVWTSTLTAGMTLTLYAGEGTSGAVLATATSFADVGGGRFEAALAGVDVVAGQRYTVRLTASASIPWMVGTYSYPGASSSTYGTSAHFGVTTYLRDARVVVSDAGRLGVVPDAPTAALDLAADRIRLRSPRTPASGSACNQGEWSWDASFLYVCVATNTWRRATLAAY